MTDFAGILGAVWLGSNTLGLVGGFGLSIVKVVLEKDRFMKIGNNIARYSPICRDEIISFFDHSSPWGK